MGESSVLVSKFIGFILSVSHTSTTLPLSQIKHNHMLTAVKTKKVWWKVKTGGNLDFDINNGNWALPKLLIWNRWNKNETLNYLSCRNPSNLGFQSISQIKNCIHYYCHQVSKLLLNAFYKKDSERFIHMQNEISSLLTKQPTKLLH